MYSDNLLGFLHLWFMEVPPTTTSGCSQSSQKEEEVFTPEQAELWGVGGEMDLGKIFGVLSFQ